MLKGMDNETIKSMMKAQGMNISDEQINMMRNPEMLHQAQKQIKNNPNLFNMGYSGNLNHQNSKHFLQNDNNNKRREYGQPHKLFCYNY